ncbi:MAG TPA: acyclic terpene utilization AtuA family protein [Ilumatobacter sp.]|nr:acyclic terpene utilization AtuA family protein [Ilumatobacter sp.]
MAATPGGPIRIANCSGFFGDRLSGAREMVEGGPIDVLTGDWLAELTMLILSRIRAKQPGRGFAGTFVTQMEQVLGTCLDRGIKVVSNAGGLDPAGCAEAVQQVADRLGVAPTIAYVDGDDLMPRLAELAVTGALAPFDDGNTGELGDPSQYVTANAYLGCWGIVEALTRGADVVITGRVTDAAVVMGPAAWHHGWARDDWNPLAGALAAGHLIECSAQVAGGNYSFFEEVPGIARIGFPWAEVAADGSAVIGKHDGTGGLISVGTVTSQLLYEIGGPLYHNPDVTGVFTTVDLEQVGPDRVRVSGTVGVPPPATLKVAMNRFGGYRNQVSVALTGLDVEAKADVVQATFWDACPFTPGEFGSVTTRLIRHDHPDPASNEEATAELRITVKDADERKVGRAFTNAFTETALASIPGLYALSGSPTPAQPYGVYVPATVPADLVPQYVHVGGTTVQVASGVVSDKVVEPVVATPVVEPVETTVPTERVPLGCVVGTRSGDKGGNANLGVFTRTAEAFDWLAGYLTVDRLRELLPETAPLQIERHVFRNVWALNFVIHGLLDEGVAASTRVDAQAKSLGEWLRARAVDVPSALL